MLEDGATSFAVQAGTGLPIYRSQPCVPRCLRRALYAAWFRAKPVHAGRAR